MKMFQLIKPDTKIDFMGKTRPAVLISLVLIVISIGLLFTIGPRYGIDFRGGTEMIVHFEGDISDDEVREAASNLGLHDASVQRYGTPEDRRFLIQTQEVSVVDREKITEIEAQLAEVGTISRVSWNDEQPDRLDLLFESHVDPERIREAVLATGLEQATVTAVGQSDEARYTVRFQDLQDFIRKGFAQAFGERFSAEEGLERLETVGPRAGEQLRNSGILSVAIALLAILIYIWFRFDVRYSPGAVLAQAHDVIITLGVFVVFQIEITLPVIAAFLTIVGYSLNDTIVVFDRIRENVEKAGNRPLKEVVNASINETLSRTIITSLTTLFAVVSIAVIGSGLIETFAIALIIGILVGTYSSIFIAAPLMIKMDTYLRERRREREIIATGDAPNGTV